MVLISLVWLLSILDWCDSSHWIDECGESAGNKCVCDLQTVGSWLLDVK